MKNKKLNSLMASPYILWSIAFIIIPLIMVFYYGLTDKDGAFTLENITAIATPEHIKALSIALLLSLISTIICLLLAYPLAMILSNMKGNQERLIVLIFILPMWMNFLLRTLAWQTLLEKSGVINQVLGRAAQRGGADRGQDRSARGKASDSDREGAFGRDAAAEGAAAQGGVHPRRQPRQIRLDQRSRKGQTLR